MNSEENSKQKFLNQMAKSKVQTYRMDNNCHSPDFIHGFIAS